jgi:hypothetical protein
MPAPKGNNYGKKWKTPEDRKAACAAVCEHLSKGLSKKCFPLADWDTVEAYIRDYPEDFPSEKIKEAERLNLKFWESIGVDGATGANKDFNAASWIFNMKNRFRSDWTDTTKQDVNVTGLEDLFAEIAASGKSRPQDQIKEKDAG